MRVQKASHAIMAVLLAVAAASVGHSLPADDGLHPRPISPAGREMAKGSEQETLFFLKIDERLGKLVDMTGRSRPVIHGAEVVEDAAFGKCLRFGGGLMNGITVKDVGHIRFDGGFTLDMWLQIEESGKPNPGGSLATKGGSFAFAIKDYKLNNQWMRFPTERVYTNALTQYSWYPAESEAFFGSTIIPANKWVRVTVTYDEELRVIRTWINGGIDRTRYLARGGAARLLSDPASSIEFMKGMKNCRIYSIRLAKGRPELADAVAPLEVYVQPLPYREKILISIDHVSRGLALPVDVAVIFETPAGETKLVKEFSLQSHDRRDVLVDAPKWKGALHTVTVKAYSRQETVLSRSVRIAGILPKGRVRIHDDKSISVDGKRIFPLAIYHVFPEDYQAVAASGFNIIIPRGPSLKFMGLGGSDGRTMSDIKTCLDEAQKQHVLLLIEGNTVFGNLNRVPLFKDHPALFGWAGFDEPWGALDKVQESYNVVKLLDPDSPIYCTQNNASRFAETAQGADILACDPYPLPRISLRYVADQTRAAVAAVAGLKPVWTILDQYEGKRPDLRELRAMAYLAVISGANGIGIYAWDERRDRKTGWYTKEHPEDRQVLKSVVQELKKLETILIEPNAARKAHFSPANSALHAALKESGGKTYLFVANDSRKKEAGDLSVEGFASSSGVCLSDVGTCRDIQFRNGKAAFSLPPLGTAVYEIR